MTRTEAYRAKAQLHANGLGDEGIYAPQNLHRPVDARQPIPGDTPGYMVVTFLGGRTHPLATPEQVPLMIAELAAFMERLA